MRRVLAAVLMLTACYGEPKRRVQFKDIADSNGVPTPPPPPFQAPDDWETVTLRNGMTFRQPEAFTFGLGGARLRCDDETPGADSAVFPRDLNMTWPLTLSMRRGDLARIAFNNGFTIDSTEMAEHGTAVVPTVLRGEGWFLIHGHNVLFGSTRAPAGCMVIWAARGQQINADTLGLVMSTVKFSVVPDSTP